MKCLSCQLERFLEFNFNFNFVKFFFLWILFPPFNASRNHGTEQIFRQNTSISLFIAEPNKNASDFQNNLLRSLMVYTLLSFPEHTASVFFMFFQKKSYKCFPRHRFHWNEKRVIIWNQFEKQVWGCVRTLIVLAEYIYLCRINHLNSRGLITPAVIQS